MGIYDLHRITYIWYLKLYCPCLDLYSRCLDLYLGVWNSIWVSGLVFRMSGLVSGCLDLCFECLDLYSMGLHSFLWIYMVFHVFAWFSIDLQGFS